jgi:hypothetical protein
MAVVNYSGNDILIGTVVLIIAGKNLGHIAETVVDKLL